ncbi:accessory Sec system protein Asp2 [Streptococcus sp. zg-JUN1979]|uniref:accessory Sec system protein Asp2 n=1 Tax=Streptococcus sp. zg-JUN1979 TaxID=3391450 RepID=UPI0039A4D5B9
MSKTITVLQIGVDNWADTKDVVMPDNLKWLFCQPTGIDEMLEKLKKEQVEEMLADDPDLDRSTLNLDKVTVTFSAILLTSYVSEDDLNPLMDSIEAYALFSDEKTELDEPQKRGFFRRKCLRELRVADDYQALCDYLAMNLFSGQYGAKLKVSSIDVVPDYQGKVMYFGNKEVVFEGEYGEEFQPLYTFRYGFPSFEMGVEIWPEYTKDETTEIYWLIEGLRAGALGEVDEIYHVTEEQLQKPFVIAPNKSIGAYNVTVYAKGAGKMAFGSLHWRYSRMGLGQFVLGGKRFSDHKRQELAYYFNPGDMKPPLNVYFSGFRGAEGFEGFFMMKRLGAPFLLVADPRLEGGCFYMGTKELENQVVEAISGALDYLDFDHSELILSGLSMGAYGGVYYAPELQPAAVIVGKPFTNLGDTVNRLKTLRPEEFETSADMLSNIMGDNNYEDAEALNERFWHKFKAASYPNTTFAIAYMQEDDYDGHAFAKLVDYMADKTVHIYGKGYTGRHNDDSRSVNQWFISQYHRLLKDKFGRNF